MGQPDPTEASTGGSSLGACCVQWEQGLLVPPAAESRQAVMGAAVVTLHLLLLLTNSSTAGKGLSAEWYLHHLCTETLCAGAAAILCVHDR